MTTEKENYELLLCSKVLTPSHSQLVNMEKCECIVALLCSLQIIIKALDQTSDTVFICIIVFLLKLTQLTSVPQISSQYFFSFSFIIFYLLECRTCVCIVSCFGSDLD